ncbi:MAG: hypothetical protein Q8L30_00770 [bacterium]|nr:hypothetical protein [bacterium]
MDTPTQQTASSGPEPTKKAVADMPKKYIRTFAGDIEAIKKGWTPNLAPLKSSTPAQNTESVEVQEPIFVQNPSPIESRPESDFSKLSPIETYESDFSKRIKDTNASTATILAAEQDANTSVTTQGSPKKLHRNNTIYIIVGAVFIVLGVAGSYVAYTRYLADIEPVTLAPTVFTPIFVDEKEEISGTNPRDMLQAIERSNARQLAQNMVRFIYANFATTTNSSVFTALQLPAPNTLIRNVNADRSMAGIVSAGGSQNPFFVLSVSSYGDTFAGMLSWESTMVRDMSALFPPLPADTVDQTASSTPSATTTTAIPVLTQAMSFRDEVVNNHDVRIYRDANSRSILLYGYWNKSTLVIARDPAAFTEITDRLATTRTQSSR